jgi:DtxR family Mn-dependent transcriptional regulator
MAEAKSNNLSASLEDYLEAIFNLASDSDVARSTDIAKALGVAKPSVTGALKLLAERGLVNYRPYGYVTLTDSGLAEASRVARKHDIIKLFFVNVLGVKEKTAQQAACGAEHALGPDVIGRLLCFIEFLNKNNKNGYNLTDEFRKFCRNRLKGSKIQNTKIRTKNPPKKCE